MYRNTVFLYEIKGVDVSHTLRGRRQCDPVSGCGKKYKVGLDCCPYCGCSEQFSTFTPYDTRDWIYDIETYPNVFTASFKHVATGKRWKFEISGRTNQLSELITFLVWCEQNDTRHVGFNNVGFDYPVIHYIMTSAYIGLSDIYGKAQSIINCPWEDRFSNTVRPSDVLIPQIDLYKVHHFDNDARATSLKMLEFNMSSDNIEDLPYVPGTYLLPDEIERLITYNDHDVDETEKFYFESLDQIEFREDLSNKYDRNFMNHNDTKIGKDYFIMELEKHDKGSCYVYADGGGRVVRQTHREVIRLADAVFPYIKFERSEFEEIRQYFLSKTITETKGVFSGLSAEVDGFEYDFGVGGIHGSIASQIVRSDDDYVIYDWDVASYYPNLAIVNNLHPEHLGQQFCTIYKDVYEQRKQYAKGTAENAMLKLALNGVYGDSNNKYSPFYDPLYTMATTINGQLLLCMLAEQLIKIPRLSMIQINTDGLTIRCPRDSVDHMKAVCKWWEDYTLLTLESAVYSAMYIRDVNNYIAVYDDGKVKRKGAYEYSLEWHQNHSQKIVAKAAEAYLLHGINPDHLIRSWPYKDDFMLRAKVGRADTLMYKDENGERELQRITRYYVSNTGGGLTKISPPAKKMKVGTWKRATKLKDAFYNKVLDELKSQNWDHLPAEQLDSTGLPWDERINTKNKSKYEIRHTGIASGWKVTPCNDRALYDMRNINYVYYLNEVAKLVNPLRTIEE